ncbi:MAG TPA: IucA/IucC family C-terminal-domain containing protein [Enterobacteriaceae bacterium]|nr:IucA/IucC family C-terminal-domain containing protein [Enterobacteriaceae bacterium]
MKHTGLTEAQWHSLSQTFRLRPGEQADARSLPAREWLDEAGCAALLERLAPVIGAPDAAIAASLLVKRLAFLVSGNVLYAMTVFNQGLHLDLNRTHLEYAHDNGLWTSALPVEDLQFLPCPPDSREAWREAIVDALFAGFFAPLCHALSRSSGLPVAILWENIAVRVYSLYEGRMANLDAQAERRRREDFAWLTEQASPGLFGLDNNPLKRFRRPAKKLPEGQGYRRFRRTCCFYYKASKPVEYCLNCPLNCAKPQ